MVFTVVSATDDDFPDVTGKVASGVVCNVLY